jgi:hypothetical protein
VASETWCTITNYEVVVVFVAEQLSWTAGQSALQRVRQAAQAAASQSSCRVSRSVVLLHKIVTISTCTISPCRLNAVFLVVIS